MKNRKHRLWQFLYKLHRYIGLASAIVLIMLAVTGIALNHTEELNLDGNMIQSPTLLDWYGIKSPDNLKSFATTHHWLSQVNQQIYFDDSPLLTNENTLLGAVETDDFIVAAFNNSLILLSIEGKLIEQNSYERIESIGLDSQLSIFIQSNNIITYSNDGLLSWQAHKNKNIIWSSPSQLPESLAQSIKNNFRSTILPMERLLLDLHSGRFFGIMGVIIVDLCGIFLIILALSGTAIWLKHKLRSLLHNYRQ
jgi:hypothetical protein